MNIFYLCLVICAVLLIQQGILRIKKEYFSIFSQKLVYFLIMAVPFFVIEHKDVLLVIEFNLTTFIGIIMVLCLLFLHIKEFRINFSKEIWNLMSKLTGEQFFSEILGFFLSSPFEEIFFRAFIIFTLFDFVGYYVIFINSFCFVLHHYFFPWAKKQYSKKQYFSQFILSIILSTMYIMTNNLLLIIILHYIYNFPFTFGTILRFLYEKKYVKEEISNESTFFTS